MNRKTFILTLMLLMLAGLSTWAENPDGGSGTVAKIGDTEYETLDGAFAAAQGGNTIEIIQADTYTLPSPISNLTIKGCDGVVFNAMKEYGQSVSLLHDVAFESVKFIFGSNNYTGFQHSESVKFTKCSFEGKFNSYGTMLFDQCTFNSPEGDYSMWCYAGDVTYRNCTINCNGKFVNVYNEGNTTADRPWKVVAEECTFNSTFKNKAAFNIKATCGTKPLYYDVAIKNCKANGENWPAASTSESLVVGSALWQVDDIKAGVASKINVTVDGNAVFPAPVAKIGETGYASLEKAIAAVPTDGTETTITMIDDDSYTGTNPIEIASGKTIILDLNGKTISYVSDNNASDAFITNKGKLTIIDGTEKGKITAQQNTDWNHGSYTINNFSGNLVINGGTIENTSGIGLAWPLNNGVYGSNADMVINGGTIHSTNYVPVREYLMFGGTKTITINGGTFVSNNSRAIAVQFTDASVAETGSYVKVNGGTFDCNGSGIFYFDLHADNVNTTGLTFEVTAGSFTNADAESPVVAVDYEGREQSSAVLPQKFISGGTFSKAPDAKYVAEGYEVVEQDNAFIVQKKQVAKIGETTYSSLEKAIAAVPTNGTETTTVQMIDDITLSDKLLIDGGKKLILDLGGKTLTGRVNVSGAELTVKNGTINAGTFNQALNVYGSKEPKYKDGIFTYVKVEENVILDGATCALGIMSILGEIYYPLSYGVKVDFYGKATNMPAQVSGNIGFDNYKANIGNVDISANLPEGIQAPSKAMSLYGPIVNIYGEMKSSVTEGECQAFILSGMARVNVYDGATIEGSEGFAMKSGNLHVYGGTIKSNGQKINPVQAVSSGSEASGAAISITSFYTSNLFEDRAKISVVVENGEIIGGNNSALLVTHSYKDNSPVALEQGVNLAINGGKFSCGVDVPVLFIDNAATGDAFTMPSAFVSSGLFKIAPEATYLATGKTVIGNPDLTTETAYPYAVVPLADKVQVAAEVEIASVEEETPLTSAEQTAAETTVDNAIKDMAENTEVANLPDDTKTSNNKAVATGVVETNQSVGINVEFTGTKVSVETETGGGTVTLKELTFDVTPYVVEKVTINEQETSVAVKKIENEQIKAPMTFRLPIPSNVEDQCARVIHHKENGEDEDMGLYSITINNDKKYIEISTPSFSQFDIVLKNVSAPTNLSYYAGNSTEKKNTDPNAFLNTKATEPNAIAFVGSEHAIWATEQTNVVVDYSVGTNGHYYECPKFVLTDLKDFYTPVDFHVVNGSYTRDNTGNTGIKSMCLPFDLKATDIKASGANFGVYHGTDMGAESTYGNVYFNKVSEVQAGTPCIVEGTDASTWNITLNGKTIKASINNTGAMKGTYVKNLFTESEITQKYKVSCNGDKFTSVTTSSHAWPFRAYLDLHYDESYTPTSEIKELNIVWDDEATGIESIKSVDSNDGVVYDLTGRRVAAPVKGHLYIINGRKQLMK